MLCEQEAGVSTAEVYKPGIRYGDVLRLGG